VAEAALAVERGYDGHGYEGDGYEYCHGYDDGLNIRDILAEAGPIVDDNAAREVAARWGSGISKGLWLEM
jgi:hypothetical protein